MNPSYLDFDSVPSDIISKMESQFRQELLDSGKPENILDQILK
jgi:translation elongation factor EF-Ts